MPTGLFSQLALIVLSLGIIFTYIQPTLDGVKSTQNTIGIYKTEREKVANVNAKLDRVSATLNSINADDQRRLLTYMPDAVDTVAVPRDVKAIADKAGVILTQIKYAGPKETTSNSAYVDPSLLAVAPDTSKESEAHFFTVDFEASYEQLKQVLADLERNAYPLEVHQLTVEKTEGGFLSVTLKIVTYDRIVPTLQDVSNQVVS